jgi:hypothetical protein
MQFAAQKCMTFGNSPEPAVCDASGKHTAPKKTAND